MDIYFCGINQSVRGYLWSANCGYKYKYININVSGTFSDLWKVSCLINRVVPKVGTEKGRLLSTSCWQSKALDKGKVATKDSLQCLTCSNTLPILQGGDEGYQAQCWTSVLVEEPTPLLFWAVTEKLKASVVLWGKWMIWHRSSHQLIPVAPVWPWREGWF